MIYILIYAFREKSVCKLCIEFEFSVNKIWIPIDSDSNDLIKTQSTNQLEFKFILIKVVAQEVKNHKKWEISIWNKTKEIIIDLLTVESRSSLVAYKTHLLQTIHTAFPHTLHSLTHYRKFDKPPYTYTFTYICLSLMDYSVKSKIDQSRWRPPPPPCCPCRCLRTKKDSSGLLLNILFTDSTCCCPKVKAFAASSNLLMMLFCPS